MTQVTTKESSRRRSNRHQVTITGSTVSFVFHQTDPCTGTFTGTAIFDGNLLTGAFSGAGCRGNVTASLEVNRTPPMFPL